MKLYFSPGACSLSPHIILHESGLPHTIEKVDLGSKKTASGADYAAINPKGYVPALETDDGVLLTEGPAIVQYLADQVPAKNLAPAAGSIERYQMMSWLNFIGTEIHKNYSLLFNPAGSDESKQNARANLTKRYGYVERMLEGREYLVGTGFSVADGYLFVVTNWAGMLKVDLSAFPNIAAFQKRIASRPAVQAAMKAEGLLN
ncbi:glutathione transferase GstA [Massilia sp. TSP1-1-2]|uniref:glutathione transferase GstA n=1 Tax=unclassified Massilia TaxID=2609279 RepID=UPI003CEBF017